MVAIHTGLKDSNAEKSVIELITENNLIALLGNTRLLKQKHPRSLDEILTLRLGKYITYELPQSGTAIWISFPKNLDIVP